MVESTPSGAAAWEDDEDWELVNEDGFVFKRRKKRRVDPSADSSLRAPPSASAADLQEDAEKLRRERKKKSLLKLKTQYQVEIDQWELLSSTLRAVEERTCHLQEQQQQHRLNEQEREQTASLPGSGPSELQGSESVCGSVVDELLLQAEAQEAIIGDVSNLCDIAEAMCSEQEEQITQSLLDLPIWGSPRELMNSLCDP
ncbi:PREDICTED: uncharacterized protein LOC103329779 [Prunus mume]|uniref:Uncharacterized protein LOC103329779 n=1 Tax=Prunus mume TaxID=102107 RepID=A0ABM0NVM5_PRUMU|nr:PREDICTED: uncharacterized protein LOC103329779 [Prunus mume]